MKMTNEIFNQYKDQKEICSLYNDDYVILRKVMPCEDDILDKYIKSIKKAKQDGINVCAITDYKLLDESAKFGTGNYTTGVFIEERAKGTSLNYNFDFLMLDDTEVNFEEMGATYLRKNEEYINELEKRANAPQIVYDKLVNDIIGLRNYQLEVDPKPTNFFFDPEKGFTIIDVISMSKKVGNDFIADYIVSAVLGYGRPLIMVDSLCVKALPMDLQKRLIEYADIISDKIKEALVNNKLGDYTNKVDTLVDNKCFVVNETVEKADMSIHITEILALAIDKDKERNNEDPLIFN